MNDRNLFDDENTLCEPGVTLADLIPLIDDINLSPHWAINAIRIVNSWPLTHDQKLEMIWLVGKLVEIKNGKAEDVETFLTDLHRFQEPKVCYSEDNFKSLRRLVEGEVARYGFQDLKRGEQ